MAEVLFANVAVSQLALEATSLLDHQLVLEVAAKLAPRLPVVWHRMDRGLHHNEIVVELLLKLQESRQEGMCWDEHDQKIPEVRNV